MIDPETPEERYQRLVREKQHADLLQYVREWELTHPLEIEVRCAHLPKRQRLRMMRQFAKEQLEQLARVGIKTFQDVSQFLNVISVCLNRGWINKGELSAILVRVQQMCEGEHEGKMWMWDSGGEALEKISAGLSKRIC